MSFFLKVLFVCSLKDTKSRALEIHCEFFSFLPFSFSFLSLLHLGHYLICVTLCFLIIFPLVNLDSLAMVLSTVEARLEACADLTYR